MIKLFGREGNLSLGPEFCFPGLGKIAMKLDWRPERLSLQEQLIAICGTAEQPNGFRCANRQFAEMFAGLVVNEYLRPGTANIGHDDSCFGNCEVLDRRIPGGNYVDKFHWLIAVDDKLDHASVRRIAVSQR